MAEQTYTLREANALVPWLSLLFAETRRYLEELEQLRGASKRRRASSIPGVVLAAGHRGEVILTPPEEVERMRVLEAEIKSRMDAARMLGLLVRRVDGLVDIPARVHGRAAFFCWRFGEPEISHWHGKSEDDLARRPLSGLASAVPISFAQSPLTSDIDIVM